MSASMDSTHAAVGIGAGGSVGVLAGLIAGTWHLDPTLSADWAMAVVGAAGFVGGYVTWFIRWKWPGAPPLPGDTVTIPGPITATVAGPAPAVLPLSSLNSTQMPSRPIPQLPQQTPAPAAVSLVAAPQPPQPSQPPSSLILQNKEPS